jgi:hypothetical protein
MFDIAALGADIYQSAADRAPEDDAEFTLHERFSSVHFWVLYLSGGTLRVFLYLLYKYITFMSMFFYPFLLPACFPTKNAIIKREGEFCVWR